MASFGRLLRGFAAPQSWYLRITFKLVPRHKIKSADSKHVLKQENCAKPSGFKTWDLEVFKMYCSLFGHLAESYWTSIAQSGAIPKLPYVQTRTNTCRIAYIYTYLQSSRVQSPGPTCGLTRRAPFHQSAQSYPLMIHRTPRTHVLYCF